MLDVSNHLLEQSDGFAKSLSFIFRQSPQGFRQSFHAALAPFPHDFGSFGGRCQADAPPVFGRLPADQPGALEPGYDAAHGGGTDLLGIGQLAERPGTAKHQDGKGGKLRGANAAFAVANTKAAQQVDRCRVELVGDVHGSQGGCNRSGLMCRCSGRRGGFRGRPIFVLDRGHGI